MRGAAVSSKTGVESGRSGWRLGSRAAAAAAAAVAAAAAAAEAVEAEAEAEAEAGAEAEAAAAEAEEAGPLAKPAGGAGVVTEAW